MRTESHNGMARVEAGRISYDTDSMLEAKAVAHAAELLHMSVRIWLRGMWMCGDTPWYCESHLHNANASACLSHDGQGRVVAIAHEVASKTTRRFTACEASWFRVEADYSE